MLVGLIACGTEERAEDESRSADPEASFASYAQVYYRELNETPLSDSVEVDVGLFGDLNVMAGENVVMGRYRYRVDTTQGDVSAHLTFFARTPAEADGIPIVLAFEKDDGTWMLRETGYVPADNDTEEASSLERILDRRLDDWAQEASDAVSPTTRVFP